MTVIKPDHATQRPRTAAALLDQLEMWGLKLGLDRIAAVLAALGRPDHNYAVVLVAGTNGKGTTAATLASILFHSGYRVGLFTSPHLESVRERIRVDGTAIDERQLFSCLDRVRAAAAKRENDPLPSYFEAVTASALQHFSDRKVDIAVLEVGLGGRLDATNVTDPVLSIITSIAHDHQEHLGHRLDQIATEKAGVARPGRPLLAWAPGQAQVQGVLRDFRDQGVLVEEVWRTLSIEPAARGSIRIVSGASPPAGPSRTYTLNLAGAPQHQRQNTAIALRAAEQLAQLGFDRVDPEGIVNGVHSCRWPGRLETVALPTEDSGDPPGPATVLLDGAHNPAGAKALAAHLRAAHHGQRPNLLFGSLKGKNAAAALATLAPWVDRIWLTSPTNSRALEAAALAKRLERYRPQLARRCTVVAEFGQALKTAVNETDGHLVVCGSLYGVGEARTWLHQRFGVPAPAAEVRLFDSVCDKRS